MTIVSIYMPQRSTITGDKLVLTKSDDFSVLNGAGDSLNESGTSGWFTCNVAEPWTVSLGAAVVDSGGLVPVSGVLGVGSTIVSDAVVELDSASMAEINAQVVDALSVDTYAELSSPPAATSSLKDKLTWLFMWARNKATETSTQRKLYADDNTTVVSTETVGDDGATFTKGKSAQ